jgi:hypothetical protein
MTVILDTAASFFEEDGWPFSQIGGQSIFQMGFRGDSGQWTCYAEAREEQQQFIFYSVCPVNAPEPKRPAAAEFLTRANYGLIVGNFEMDWDDGEIRYKTSIDVEGDRLSSALIRQLVYANVLMMDVYLPGILLVLFGDISPAEVIARLEEGDLADRD